MSQPARNKPLGVRTRAHSPINRIHRRRSSRACRHAGVGTRARNLSCATMQTGDFRRNERPTVRE